jgi:hypothetical protein
MNSDSFDRYYITSIIAIINIAIILSITISANIRVDRSYKKGHTQGLEEGLKVYQAEAVQKGLGIWVVESNGTKVTFEWIE